MKTPAGLHVGLYAVTVSAHLGQLLAAYSSYSNGPIGTTANSPQIWPTFMASPQDPQQNRLLAALPANEFECLAPQLELVPLKPGEVLYEPGGHFKYVCFSTDAIVTLLYVMEFDNFIEIYNNQRPHQALGGAYPGDIYTPSARVYEPPPEPDYPYHDRSVRVTRCGRICIGRRKINLSTVFAGQTVGVTEVEDQIWLVSFLDYDLGYFDKERGRVKPGPNPFVPDKVLTMCPE